MPRISTHVLDIALGRPAVGIEGKLLFHGEPVARFLTNEDGRTDGPLLEGESLLPGTYEIIFHAGPYLQATGLAGLFFGDITLRFYVNDPLGNYHVPLLLAPHGYSTYRGS